MARANTIRNGAPRGKYLIRLFSILALIIFICSGYAWWWHSVRSNPERVFNAMLENNLKTTGVTDRLVASNGQQGLDQTIRLMTSPRHLAHAHTILSQSGSNAASVKTETIGTPTADYVRYLAVDTGASGGTGNKFDFSKVENLWGKAAVAEGTEQTETTGELYNQTVLAVVPIGNLPLKTRRALLDQIKSENVYTVDYSKVERTIRNGRPEYSYPVSIKADSYVGVLKSFARSLGLTNLERVDPSEYAGGEPIQITLGVDVWSQRLTRIEYDGGSRTETLSGFGGQINTVLPKETIPIEELQMRVQSLQ